MSSTRTVGQGASRQRGRDRKGYREQGQIYIQLRRSYVAFAREHGIHEAATFTDLLRMLYRDVSGDRCVLPDKLHYEFYLNGQRLTASNYMVDTVLDGGETISVKVFDDDGMQYVWDMSGWEPKG